MIFQITTQEIEELKRHQRQRDDKSVYTKVTALLMLFQVFSVKEVFQTLDIDISTVYCYANTRYYNYKNKELTKWVKATKISQMFLPLYLSNLNLIEKLWRFLRKRVINTECYRIKKKNQGSNPQFL